MSRYADTPNMNIVSDCVNSGHGYYPHPWQFKNSNKKK